MQGALSHGQTRPRQFSYIVCLRNRRHKKKSNPAVIKTFMRNNTSKHCSLDGLRSHPQLIVYPRSRMHESGRGVIVARRKCAGPCPLCTDFSLALSHSRRCNKVSFAKVKLDEGKIYSSSYASLLNFVSNNTSLRRVMGVIKCRLLVGQMRHQVSST